MDVKEIRNLFPVTKNKIYLDNASLCAIPTPVVEAVQVYLREHSEGGVDKFWGWLDVKEETRRLIAELVNASPEEIAFMQNTSDGISAAANSIGLKPGDNVVINDLEYFPNVYAWGRFGDRGVDVRVIKNNCGYIGLDDIKRHCDAKTRAVALSHVAWINGLTYDLDEVGSFCRENAIYFVVDAIQSVGAINVNLGKGMVDFLAAAGHKWLLSPLGTGFFYCRKDLIPGLEPVALGWQSDVNPTDYSFRARCRLAPTADRFMTGNISIAGVFGLRASLNLMKQIGFQNIVKRNMSLANYLVEQIKALGFEFLTPVHLGLGSPIVNFLTDNAEDLRKYLAAEGIAVSQRAGGIRVSPNFYNLESEIDCLVEKVRQWKSGGERA